MIIGNDDLVPAAVERAGALLRVARTFAERRPDHQPTANRYANVQRWYDRFTTRHDEWASANLRTDQIKARLSMGTCLGAMERETVGSACSALGTGSSDAGRTLVNEMIDSSI